MDIKSSGVDKSFSHSVKANNEAAAEQLYKEAKARLLNVAEWHYYAGKGTAAFQRMNNEGVALTGNVALNDRIRIDIPGPGRHKGFDWVQVEELSDVPGRVHFRVRPCADPTSEEDSTAHFLSSEATSTFIVEKKGFEVSTKILGKNEQLNTTAETLPEKVRDILVGIGAMAGASDIQWNKLVKGLLEYKNQAES